MTTKNNLEAWVMAHAAAWDGRFYFTYNSSVPLERNGAPVFYEVPYNGKIVCALHPEVSEAILAICRRKGVRAVYINLSNMHEEGITVQARQPRRPTLTDCQMRTLLRVLRGVPLVYTDRFYLIQGDVAEPINRPTINRLLQLALVDWDGDYLVPTVLAWQEYGHLVGYPTTPISRFRKQAEKIFQNVMDQLPVLRSRRWRSDSQQ